MNETLQRYALAVLAHAALLLAWYLFVKLGDVPKFVMPSPGETLNALLQPDYNWWTNIAATANIAARPPDAGEIRMPVSHARGRLSGWGARGRRTRLLCDDARRHPHRRNNR